LPLCYPATLALMDLWRFVSPVSGTRLENVRRDVAALKDFVWEVLLARGFSDDGLLLPCSRLGELPTTEALDLRLSEYVVSTFYDSRLGELPTTEALDLRLNEYVVSTFYDSKQSALNAELAAFRERCLKLKISLLYRCPNGCADVDFFVLRADGSVFAIQTSISALLDHGAVDTIADTIANVPSRFGVTIERYIFVTATPVTEQLRNHNTLTKLTSLRMVSSKELVGE
jgi:hypothetical protein